MIPRAVPLALALAVAACTSATGGGDELPGRGEYIVYSVSPSVQSDRQMFRIRPDGTQKLAMTDPVNKSNDSPSFNSDGNTVLFLSSREFLQAGPFAPRHLFRTSIDATLQTRVTANSLACNEGRGQFSADDKAIAFTLACSDGTTPIANLPLVYRINADGTGQARVVSDHPLLASRHAEPFAAFTASGRIVFVVDFLTDPNPNVTSSLTRDLFSMDPDGKNTTRLTNLAAEGRTTLDQVTVHGNAIYFVTQNLDPAVSNAQLEAINVDGSGRSVLYRIPANPNGAAKDSQFTVSPNGTSIAFVRFTDGVSGFALMTADLDGSNAKAIDTSGYAATPAWK